MDDGIWQYDWNADNRLVVLSSSAVETNGSFRIENIYDSQERRVQKVLMKLYGRGVGYPLTSTKAGVWVPEVTRDYVWNDWHLVYERITDHASGDIAHKMYVWGLDLSGTLQDAGGVGGLLMETHISGSSVTHYYAIADANGNVTDYVDKNGAVVAHYEYSHLVKSHPNQAQWKMISLSGTRQNIMIARRSCIITGIGITTLCFAVGSAETQSEFRMVPTKQVLSGMTESIMLTTWDLTRLSAAEA